MAIWRTTPATRRGQVSRFDVWVVGMRGRRRQEANTLEAATILALWRMSLEAAHICQGHCVQILLMWKEASWIVGLFVIR